jgi:hypothetical protein
VLVGVGAALLVAVGVGGHDEPFPFGLQLLDDELTVLPDSLFETPAIPVVSSSMTMTMEPSNPRMLSLLGN